MPEASPFLTGLGVLLVAVVLLWFTVGTQVNVRKGERVLRWLQGGLPLLGPRTTLRWLGSSVAELTIVRPRAPYRSALVMVVLEPRDLGALWALSRWRGRRDCLIVRLDLVRAPRYRADLIAHGAWTSGHRRSDDAPFSSEQAWTDATGTLVRVRQDGDADVDRLRASWDALRRLSGSAWRISVRPLVPHLEIHMVLPSAEAADARQILAAVGELAEAVAAPR